ncbi:MAG: NADH-quinone oxidoreductase subunit NuoK [Symbiobacteriia bacterium]
MSIPIIYPLSLAAFLFAVGLYGALTKTNAIRILMSIELMLNAVNLNLITFSRYITPNNYRGQILTVFVMTVAAAEAAVGLALVLVLGRNRNLVDIDKITLLKG